MQNDLLEEARQQTEKADASVRAAALLRIARVEAHGDHVRARQTLLEGFHAVQELPSPEREHLLKEARVIAAGASPDLLSEIPTAEREMPPGLPNFESVGIVQAMITHRHIDAAFEYLVHQNDPESFPFMSIGVVVQKLDPNNPQSAARRMTLLGHAAELWRQSLANGRERGLFLGHHTGFIGVFGHFWKDFPSDEALTIARTIVDQAAKERGAGTSAGYSNEVHFSSPRQDTLFQVLHILRHLDPALAQSLVDSNDQLEVAARRYPNGLETMHEEMEAEAERRKADEATCRDGACGGYFLSGDPEDFARQRRIIDAARSGDFAPSIEDALDKYRQDTSPDAPNHAPKEYWPSTGAFRSTLYQAGKHLGFDASKLLESTPDDDLRLFAGIELAAALSNACAPLITSMKQSRPPGAPQPDARIISARCHIGPPHTEPPGPSMRSPDGRLIRCHKCRFQPSDSLRWSCKCGHVWNTFWTAGKCPACQFQWEETGCPQCGEMSKHRAWYVSEP